MAEEETTATMAGPFHLELHAWMESQHAVHGVRHEDYAQYQKYCTNRLKRLSHHPDVKKYLVCSSKYASGGSSSGGGNKSKSKHAYASRKAELLESFVTGASASETDGAESSPQTPISIPHENILWYFLVLSERAWACAKGRRHQSGDTNIKRGQVLKKYKKAQDWAQILVDMASASTSNVDETTVKECQAYLAWMKGNYAMEKLDYATAMQEFANAMTLCHELSQTTPTTTSEEDGDRKKLERQDLFLTRADTLLRPLFRYCHYELKQAGASISVQEPRGPSATTTSTPSEDDMTISFRGYDLVLDDKDLRVLLLKYQSLQQQLASSTTATSEKSFLEMLSILDDAMDVVQSALAGYSDTVVVGPTIQAKRNNLMAWKGYLQNQKTSHVMDHTQALLLDIEGHAERVHVYDALLQHANSLLALPKPSQSAGEESKDDAEDGGDDDEEDEFALQVQANCLRLRALKCFHMAWHYYQKLQKYPAALGLLQQAAKLSKRAVEEIAASEDMANADAYMEELENLPISSSIATVKAAMYLQRGSWAAGGAKNGSSSSSAAAAAALASQKSTNRPLLLRLDDADSGMVMADILPMPMFVKPVFFDMAYDYAMDTTESIDKLQDFIDEHTVPAEEEEKEEESTTKSSGGLFSWLTG